MKKILLVVAFTLIGFLSFAQNKVFYMRAETFQLGTKTSSGNVIWNESTLKSCDILIKLEEKEAVIYSNTKQVYHVISYDGNEGDISKWYCSNENGKTCNVYLLINKNQPEKLGFVVEFSDYLWSYICRPTN